MPVRLTTDELTELPLAAAWYREDGSTAGTTPEWSGAGVDTAQYRFGSLRLVVATDAHNPQVAALSARVLDELDVSARTAPGDAELVRRCLRAALHLVMGQPDFTVRSADDVLAGLRESAAEENLEVNVGTAMSTSVCGGDTVALVLKQLASNARKHAAAEDLIVDEPAAGTFRLRWRGDTTQGTVRTSRHPDNRARWGLALVRLAADALGASVIPVHHQQDGTSEATFALLPGSARFTLPLAAIDQRGHVERATRAWDEETGLTPGHVITDELAQLVRDAMSDGGEVISRAGFRARRRPSGAWLALTPRSARDLARDLVAGVTHEAALLGRGDATVRVEGCVQALTVALGSPTEMWLRPAFDEQLPAACAAFDAPLPTVCGDGREIPPAPLVAFLAGEGRGGELALVGLDWVYRPVEWSPLLAHVASGDFVPLSSPSTSSG